MSHASPAAAQSLRDAIYQKPSERQDCCARCAKSTIIGRAKIELYCYEHRYRVSSGGICAVWVPVGGTVAA